MADVGRVGGKGGGSEYSRGEPPRVSSTLAHNVGLVSKVAKDVMLEHGSSNLAGRVHRGPEGDTAKGIRFH